MTRGAHRTHGSGIHDFHVSPVGCDRDPVGTIHLCKPDAIPPVPTPLRAAAVPRKKKDQPAAGKGPVHREREITAPQEEDQRSARKGSAVRKKRITRHR
ncbi:hypothetical protein T261_05547 [Streptomyces lydicus]|nr:hypothetical protein T261_05547 [Streptomyces lydicus]